MNTYKLVAAIPLLLFAVPVLLSFVFFVGEQIEGFRYRNDMHRRSERIRRLMKDSRVARKEREADADLYSYLDQEDKDVWDEYEQARRDGKIT